MGVNGRGLGRFSFRPKSPQKGRGHLKHDFRLTERLLPDSTMTYRGRSDGLVVESDRKKIITFKFTCHLRDLQGYCVYTSGGFFFFFFFFFSFSPRQCVAPIALMDEPPLLRCQLEREVLSEELGLQKLLEGREGRPCSGSTRQFVPPTWNYK